MRYEKLIRKGIYKSIFLNNVCILVKNTRLRRWYFCRLSQAYAWLILGLRQANEKHRYNVTPSLISLGQT